MNYLSAIHIRDRGLLGSAACRDVSFQATQLSIAEFKGWKLGWERAEDEPIAIVGLAFRFPMGHEEPANFWQALLDRRDLVTQVDPSRWATRELQHSRRSEPGRSITFAAGALGDIDRFDAAFFGISPREAELMDPQQRLLLELAWEAFESAGIRPSAQAGTNCSVHVGISGIDYGMRLLDDLSTMSAHSMTGNTLSIAANRLSYVFDLRGPSVAVDTACSSSLVALHQACESLRSGQTQMALVGGVNLLLHPYSFVGFTKASMLSARGRCRPFAEDADGYVRAEGAAVLVLKPLDAAQADRDRVLAVIRASGVNADGARKSGLTIPSAEGQAELMRSVLARAGLHACDIDYVEAHGTGTRIGDPIETMAISAVYGAPGERAAPLPIGSVKSNLGHLEPASGMAGLIKAVLTLQHRTLAPSIHADRLNPMIDFEALNLAVVRDAQPWTGGARPMRVGVNSFGFGGVNAHVILEEAQRPEAADGPIGATHSGDADRPLPLVLSAHDAAALRELAQRYLPLLEEPGARAPIAQAAWFNRDWLPERLAVVDINTAEGLAALAAHARGEDAPLVVRERALAEAGKVAFVYSGNGAQWLGMGRQLMQQSPLFLRVLQDVDRAVQAHGGPAILDALAADDLEVFDDTAVAQPALFAVQVAMTELLRHFGVEADAAVGHSVGEIAAAWAAGALSLNAAARVIVARSQAQALTRGAGRMAAVGLGADALAERLRALGLDDAVEIAAVNSPRSLTVSAARPALDALRDALQGSGAFYRELDLDYAFHSRCMEPIRERLIESLDGLQTSAASGTFFSTVTGDRLDAAELGPHYWWRNVREPVQFGPAIARMAAAGYRVFVEIGPHAILQRYVGEVLDANKTLGRALAVARRDQESLAGVQGAALRAALLGARVDAAAYFVEPGRRAEVILPSYPWQRQRYWYAATSESYGLIQRRAVHPLLGYRLKEPAAAWEVHLDVLKHPWLADHRVGQAVVLPAAAYVDMALAASREWFGGSSWVIEGLDILAPVVFDGEHARTLRLLFEPRDLRFRIEGRQRLSADDWVVHAQGRLLGAASRPQAPGPTIAAPEVLTTEMPRERLYALAAALGLDYGPGFRGVERIWVGPDRLRATLAWAPQHAPGDEHVLAPAVLDQCFQAVFGWMDAQAESRSAGLTFLPVGLGRLTHWASPGAAQAAALRARLVRRSPRSVLVDFELLGADGAVIAQVQGARFRAAAIAAAGRPPALWATVARTAAVDTEPGLGVLPDCATVRAAVEQTANRDAVPGTKRYFDETAPLVEALPLAYARDALAALRESGGSSADRLRAWRAAHPLLQWCADLLQAEGVLRADGAGWTLDDQDLPPTRAIWESALAECPQALPELLRVARVGSRLARLAAGEAVHDELGAADAVDRDAPVMAFSRAAVHGAIATLMQSWPAGRRVRILDVGAGSDTCDRLRALLPGDRLDYVLARTAADDVAHLRAQFAHDADVTVAALELGSGALDSADALPDRFDIVLVDQVLHRCADAPRLLRQLAQRMQPDALLLLVERRPDRASDLAYGSDRDWWRAHEPEARGSLMPPAAWERLLQEAGWSEVQTAADPLGAPVGLGGFVVLAKPPRLALPDADAQVGDAPWALASVAGRPSALLRAVAGAMGARGEVEPTDAPPPTPERRHAWFFDAMPLELDAAELARACEWLRERLLALHAARPDASVCLVTRGGALMESDDSGASHPAAAAIWGMARVVANEFPQLRLRLVDVRLDTDQPDALARLLRELDRVDDAETEVILSADGRRVPRVVPVAPQDIECHTAADDGWRLDFTLPGQLRNLVWRAMPRRDLADDEIEIAASAAALNFRDLMYAMGLLSDEALEQGFAGPALGLEVAGMVSRCGARVTRFKPGDAVLAFAGASFASHVVVPERAAALKPEQWSFEQAATVPTVFFTVWYALHHLARLQPGERVLIHGAAGGVGIAAIQVARQIGAEIFATAGSAEKREFVALLGADHVFDSRSAGFDDAVLEQTAGQGVDVVLNSLAGEAIERNLRVLRPFGRFVELGKRDFYENTAIGLRPFRNNISYFGVDADQLMKLRPDLASQLFGEVMNEFAQGRLTPLPCRVFLPDQVVDAFRQMQQARHIGKLVIDLRQRPSHIVRSEPPKPFAVRRDGSYLITGGLSGFGLATAAWLAERGAGRLVLVGRRGAQTPGIAADLERLRALGAEVDVRACDVTDRHQVTDIVQQITRSLPPLRGVVHAAMVLDDALLPQLGAERFRKVLAPKLDGAWNLHHATQGHALDLFIVDSSATTLLGNPGQANYVAANAALEAFARWRRAQGLPATVVAWGPIGDVGVLTGNTLAREGLESRLGAAPLRSAQALDMLGRLLASDASGLAVMDFDWPTLQRSLPCAPSPRFAVLRRLLGGASSAQGDADVRALLAQLPRDQARRTLAELLGAEVAEILRLPADGVPFDRALNDLGMDSLMAVELGLALEKRLAVTISPMFLHDHPTVDRIAERLLSTLLGEIGEGDAPADSTRELVQQLAAQHAEGDLSAQAENVAEAVRRKITTGTRLTS